MAAAGQPRAGGDDAGPRAMAYVSDAVRETEAVAHGIAASAFAWFSIGAARERGRLTPLIDSEFPKISAASRILSSSFGDEIVRRAVASCLPSWWSGERETAATRRFEALHSARRTALGLPDMPGIAFPVYGGKGEAGLCAFLGTEIALDDATLPEIHGTCFRLFNGLIGLSLPGELGRLPPVSERELDFLRLTANGYTSEEIALMLNLSVHTTNQHLTRITGKLNALNRMHAVAKALRFGLIQ